MKIKNFLLILSLFLGLFLIGAKCGGDKKEESSLKDNNPKSESTDTSTNSENEELLDNQQELENELLKDPLLNGDEDSSIPQDQEEQPRQQETEEL